MLTDSVAGAVAGFAATAPMTVAMQLMHERLPPEEQYPLPPSEITAEAEERAGMERTVDRGEHQALTTLAHFGYGAACGALYAPVARTTGLPPLASGIAFGLTVWTVSYLGLLPALRILTPATEHPARRNALMITAHVVWGSAMALIYQKLQEAQNNGW